MRGLKAELLAPAGSFESMKAAVNAGADAVYIGGTRFGARAYADNLDRDRMLEAIDYAHLHGVSLYMTVNTLVKEKEFEELRDYLLPYYRHGLDAVIVQDLGVLRAVRAWFPDLHVHASTQMTVTGPDGARLLKKMGAARVVTARELSLQELAAIHDQVDIEIESFVHGALCYCYSGQCLMSSLIGGRSGNRGRCAQPCRLPYDIVEDGRRLNPDGGRYVMSLKDLCTLDILPEIIESGVYSLKIEGRMKSPRYTAGVVSVYRKYLDMYLEKGREGYRVSEEDRRILLELFDRGGYTDGYYRRHNGRDMAVMKEKPAFRQTDRNLFDRIDRTYVETDGKVKTGGKLKLAEDKPAELSLWALDVREGSRVDSPCVKVEGCVAETARNQPADPERLKRQILRTGDTPFEFGELDIDISGQVFVPVQSLNELRREALRELENEILRPYRREMTASDPPQGAGREAEAALEPSRDVGREAEAALEPSRDVGREAEAAHEPAAEGPEIAFGAAEEKVRENYGKSCEEDRKHYGKGRQPGGEANHIRIHAMVSAMHQFIRVLSEPDVAEVQIESDRFLPGDWGKLARESHNAGKECVLAMPVIFRKEAEAFFHKYISQLAGAGFDGILLRSLDEVEFLRQTGLLLNMNLYSDHNLYVFNRQAAAFLAEQGIKRATYPLELNGRELEQLAAGLSGSEGTTAGLPKKEISAGLPDKVISAGLPDKCISVEVSPETGISDGKSPKMELVAGGYFPVMVSAQCIRETAGFCGKRTSRAAAGAHWTENTEIGNGRQGRLVLRDRTGREFPVENHCAFCYNAIYNPAPLSLLGMEETVRRIEPYSLRISFLREEPEEVSAIIKAYGDSFLRGRGTAQPFKEFTRGHMKRGVE